MRIRGILIPAILGVITAVYGCSRAGTDTDNPNLKIKPPPGPQTKITFTSPPLYGLTPSPNPVTRIAFCANRMYMMKTEERFPISIENLRETSIPLDKNYYELLPDSLTYFGEGNFDEGLYKGAILWFAPDSPSVDCPSFRLELENSNGTFVSYKEEARIFYRWTKSDGLLLEDVPVDTFASLRKIISSAEEITEVSELEHLILRPRAAPGELMDRPAAEKFGEE